MGNCCIGRVAPRDNDDCEHIREFLDTNSGTIVECLGKSRLSLLYNSALAMTAINAEGMIDFALIALHATIATDVTGFQKHRRLCCALLYHSASIVYKLNTCICNSTSQSNRKTGLYTTTNIDESLADVYGSSDRLNDVFEDSVHHSHPHTHTRRGSTGGMDSSFIDLVSCAKAVLNHPVLKWESVMANRDYGHDTMCQIFCIFQTYCCSILEMIRNSTTFGEMTPQAYYRIMCQKYEQDTGSPVAYEHEFNRMETLLDELVTLCDPVIQKKATALKTQDANGTVRTLSAIKVSVVPPTPSQSSSTRKGSPVLSPICE